MENYDLYVRNQTEINKKKLDRVFEYKENIQMLSEYLKNKTSKIEFGLCHGTRRGKEQEWFKKYLGNDVKILGTEISDTATQFPDTIQWDFHKIKDEWINNVDFIYSNSLDHSYDIKFCIQQWIKCLKKGGICIINCSTGHSSLSCGKADISAFSKKNLVELIDRDTKEVEVIDVLKGRKKKWYYLTWDYVIGRKFE
tara:strand:+ start:12079 stop:12669 length:591 start_codon:yes stop_codon:yes gene_type:complete